jgi:hypothetical protein
MNKIYNNSYPSFNFEPKRLDEYRFWSVSISTKSCHKFADSNSNSLGVAARPPYTNFVPLYIYNPVTLHSNRADTPIK